MWFRNIRNMWGNKKIDISEIWMDLQQNIPGNIFTNKGHNQEKFLHEILQWKRTIILRDWYIGRRSCSQTSLGRNWMNCPKDTVPDKTILRPKAFISNSLSSTVTIETIEMDVLGILHGLQQFHHYCFAWEIHIITDHKPLVSIFKEDIATFSQGFQYILVKIYQYKIYIIYKPAPDLYMTDCLSRQNHVGNKYKELVGMWLSINSIDATTKIPALMKMQDIWEAMLNTHKTWKYI